MALNTASLATTLPIMLIGMVGIFLVIGIVIACVTLLNKATSPKRDD